MQVEPSLRGNVLGALQELMNVDMFLLGTEKTVSTMYQHRHEIRTCTLAPEKTCVKAVCA